MSDEHEQRWTLHHVGEWRGALNAIVEGPSIEHVMVLVPERDRQSERAFLAEQQLAMVEHDLECAREALEAARQREEHYRAALTEIQALIGGTKSGGVAVRLADNALTGCDEDGELLPGFDVEPAPLAACPPTTREARDGD